MDDLEKHWGMAINRYTDGRNPLQVAEDRKIIPNQKRAPCSLELKIKPFRAYLENLALGHKNIYVHLGLDYTEQHRLARPKAEYESIEGVVVDCPLMWKPVAVPPHRWETESWGIKTPSLYNKGFPHNNCGGRCVRQGIEQWLLLKKVMPERFTEVEEWEQAQRAKGGARANYGIARDQSDGQVRPVTLRELESKFPGLKPKETQTEDMFGCFCSY